MMIRGVTQIANLHPVAGDLGTFGYGYDSPLLGQRSSMSSNLGSTNYSYDSNYQLTQANYPNAAPFNGEIDSWTFDSIGNRLTSTVNSTTANYTYFKNGTNPLNGQRLQSDGTKTYTYDANGNITGDGTYTYSWDYENRLTGITGGGLTASYSYDYLGRRKSKTVNSVTTTYLYDGQNLIREVSASTMDYVFGLAIDEPLAASNGSQISYYTADGLGSIAGLNDAAGTAQSSYIYDAWGVVKSQTAAVANPFTYTARESAESGLMFYRARYYSPQIGRFISEDPLGYLEGPNFYSYAQSDPIRLIDPLGLQVRREDGPPDEQLHRWPRPPTSEEDPVTDVFVPCFFRCFVWGFADDVGTAGSALVIPAVRRWLATPAGKCTTKIIGEAGMAGAAVYCVVSCGQETQDACPPCKKKNPPRRPPRRPPPPPDPCPPGFDKRWCM
jgi:RHS repeat-associated protein